MIDFIVVMRLFQISCHIFRESSTNAKILKMDNKHRPVLGFEGLYRIYENGKVYSLISEKFITESDNGGYKRVRLHKDGSSYNKRVHVLVAEAFIPNLDGKYTVNHKDLEKSNNHVDNLEWMTYEENLTHYHNSIKPITHGETKA